MIRENRIKQRLKSGGDVVGAFAKITDPSAVEVLGLAGFDFFVLDNEHVAMNRESMVAILRAAELSDIVPVVRVRENRAVEMLQALDAGAMGVQVPHVNTKEDALHVVQSVKYAPLGHRGFASSHRAGAFGFLDPIQYVQQSNEQTLVACYCETLAAIENLPEIVQVDGLDVVFIGPWDLTQSLGFIGQLDHPDLRRHIDTIIDTTRAAHKAAGIIASDAADARQWFDRGVQYVTISSDLGMLAAQAKQFLKELK